MDRVAILEIIHGLKIVKGLILSFYSWELISFYNERLQPPHSDKRTLLCTLGMGECVPKDWWFYFSSKVAPKMCKICE